MIFLVLIVIWMAALTPFALRRLSERQVSASLSQFRHLTGMLGRPSGDPSASPSPSRPVERELTDRERRAQKARHRRRQQCRRRALAGLIGTFGFTLVFGAIPALRALWDLTILDVIATAAYIGMLAYVTRLETFEAERRALRNVYPIAPHLAMRESGDERYAATGTSQIVAKPAFRIIEVPR
jgi:hypothetical protein